MTAATIATTRSVDRTHEGRLPVVLVILWAVTAAAATGSLSARGASRATLLLPLAIAACIGLGILAVRRFELFVLAILAGRASLDAGKLAPHVASTAHTGKGAHVATQAVQSADAGRSLDPSVLVALLFVVAGVIWLLGRRRQYQIRHLPMTIPAVAFTIAAAVSLIDSRYRSNGLQELARLASVAGMLIVLEALLDSESSVRRLLIAVYVSAIPPLAMAAMQVVSHHGWILHGDTSRVRGTFLHPNPFAIYLALLIVMAVAVLPELPARARLAAWPLLGLLIATEILTYTRAAWFGVLVGLFVVGLLQSRRLIALMLLGVVVLAFAVPTVSGRVANAFEGRQASGASGNSLSWRLDYWKQSISLAKRNPVTGIGIAATAQATEDGKEPHNDIVRAFVETGIIGLAAYLTLLAGFVVLAVRSVRRAPPGLPRRIAVGFAGCVAAFLVVSLASNVVSQVVLLWYFAAFGAAAAAAARLTTPIPRAAGTH